jgi:hypothetical protein
MKMKELEPIIKYNMTDLEAKAYKIAKIWEEECQKELPKESFVKLKKNSDPRKSNLFKYCFKLLKETKGILNDNEFSLYIRAQLQILKSIKEGEVHALIEPHCLVGENAWKRWKIWKYKYNKKINRIPTSEEIQVSVKNSKIINELKETFNFLQKMNCTNFLELSSEKERILRWSNNRQISYFYILLSPWINKIFVDLTQFNFDLIYYRSSINPTVEDLFKNIFKHEFEEKL